MAKVLSRCNSSEVGIAELLIALHELSPKKDETRALIANALGLEWRGVEKLPKAKEIQPTGTKPIISRKEDFAPTAELKVPKPPIISEKKDASHGEILDPIRQDTSPFIDFSDNLSLDSVKALEQTDIDKHMKRPRYQPLLFGRWFQNLMRAMIAIPNASRDVDLTILLRDVANGLPIEKLPLRLRPTFQRGVLLFLDRSESMQPFWRDEDEFLLRLRGLLGKHKVREFWLEIDQWSPDGPKLKPFSPIPSQLPELMPLLLISDFGIGGGLSGSQAYLKPWIPLIDLAKRNNCPVVALIPAPDSFWPEILKKYIPNSFVWDRETSITTVQRQRRHIS